MAVLKNTSRSARYNRIAALLLGSILCCIALPLSSVGESLEAPPPVIISVSPSKSLAAAETLVTIYGAGIKQGASVKIGEKSVIPIAYFPPKSMTVYSPPGDPGRVDVTLTNPDGQFAVLEGGFQYVRNISGFTNSDRPIIEIKRRLNPPVSIKEKLKNFVEMHRIVIIKAGVFGGLFCLLLLLFSFSRRRKIIRKIRDERRRG